MTTLATAGLLAAASLVAGTGATPAAAVTCLSFAPSDFNGDSISDAAISEVAAPGQNHVHIIYGKRSGLTADASGSSLDDQLLTVTAFSTAFGTSLLTGDFNGDGCGDLAVGDDKATDPLGVMSGAVFVFYGSPSGLSTSPVTLNEVLAGTTSTSIFDSFGTGLAAGDFNDDGVTDLAVGAPGAEPGGAVYVFPGSRLTPLFVGAKRFTEGDGTVPGSDEAGDELGWSLAASDFNGDGRSDLVMGAWGENGGAGAVFVLRGSASSSLLTSAGRQIWTQDSAGIAGTADGGDAFGYSLATGSFKGNGREDLAIGTPTEGVSGVFQAGSVTVIYSAGAAGLSSAGNQLLTQATTGVGTPQANAEFGTVLAAGDFNGNGKTDLAVGAPWATVGDAQFAGSVSVIAGSTGGLTATGSSRWTQATGGIAGTPEDVDNFGWSLSALRVRSLAHDDLILGVPLETVGGVSQAGVAEFIPGSANGLTATGSQLWSSDSAGIKGASCAGCAFGGAVG